MKELIISRLKNIIFNLEQNNNISKEQILTALKGLLKYAELLP